MAKGKIKCIEFTLTDFDVKPIVIRETYICINGLKMNTSDVMLGHDAKIKEIGPADWRLVIGVEQLAAAVRDKAPQIEGPRFKTIGRELQFTGAYRLNRYMAVPFTARGKLFANKGKQVDLLITYFDLNGIGIPNQIKGMVENAVNPLLDVDKLMDGKREEIAQYEIALNRELDPKIDTVEIKDGAIIGTGTI